MGEMADMLMWDERDLEGDEDEPLAPAPVTCRCCGRKGLEWNQRSGKWRLYDQRGIHVCPVNPLIEEAA